MSCIIDNNKIITTPIIDILNNLQQQLYLQHINKIDFIDIKQNNARVRCPIHSNGLERTPSCDILLVDKVTNYLGKKNIVNAGTVHCFGCGYHANIVKFVADCLEISYRKAIDWLLSFVEYEIAEEVRDVEFNFDDDKKSNLYSSLPIITVEDLKKYDYIHEYMFKRKLTPDIIEKFEVGYYPEEDCLTFPVYVDGRCLFVAKRKIKYKRFELPENLNPKPIYALDYIDPNKDVYVCESIINALTLWSYGLQAIALFGTGSDYQIDLLNKTNIRKFILCLDPDIAGKKGTYRLIKGLKNKIVTYKVYKNNTKDINDLSKDEFFSLDEEF